MCNRVEQRGEHLHLHGDGAAGDAPRHLGDGRLDGLVHRAGVHRVRRFESALCRPGALLSKGVRVLPLPPAAALPARRGSLSVATVASSQAAAGATPVAASITRSASNAAAIPSGRRAGAATAVGPAAASLFPEQGTQAAARIPLCGHSAHSVWRDGEPRVDRGRHVGDLRT